MKVSKIMRMIDNINTQCIFSTLGESGTRGHLFMMGEERFNRNLRGTFFTRMVVGVWNKLSSHLDRNVLAGYGPNVGTWD